MDRARSLYNGGEIVYADDLAITYRSYIDSGLRCMFCGEPILFKGGYSRRPHFAHFPSLIGRALEECILRQKFYSHGIGWKDLVDGKGQRLEIFQTRFLSIVSRHIPNYHALLKQVRKEIETHTLTEFTNEIYTYFCSHRSLLSHKCHNFLSKDIEDYPIHLQITYEALDYLAVASSEIITKELIHNRIAVELEREAIDLRGIISGGQINQICFSIVEILAKTNWIESFRSLNSKSQKKLNVSLKQINNEKRLIVDDDTKKLDIFLSQDIGQQFSTAILTPQYSLFRPFTLNPSPSAQHNYKESFLRITSNKDIELCTITSFEVVKSSKKVCKYISLTEIKSDDLSWFSTCKRYEYLLSKLSEEISNIKILENLHYCQASDLPKYLAYLDGNEDLNKGDIVAVAYSSSTKTIFRVEPYPEYVKYYEKSKRYIVSFLSSNYEAWKKDIWLEGFKVHVKNILHNEILPKTFKVDEVKLTKVIQKLTEVNYLSLKNDYIKGLQDLIYLPPDLLQEFIKDIIHIKLSLKDKPRKE